MRDCLLCCEQREYFSLGECNHMNVCYLCAVKMRRKLDNCKCTVCNKQLDKIIMTDVQLDFSTLKLSQYPTDGNGIYYVDEKSEELCNDIDALKCPVKNCKEKSKPYPSFVLFKNHLKKDHNRVICEVCLRHSAATIDEQKLFTPGALNNHLKYGDFDENGNLVMCHPYCNFCKVSYFNDDQFGAHLKQDHFKCHVCDKKHGYTFYDKYSNLQKHFEKSHYACTEADCLEKCFIVYRTKDELEDHLIKVHKANIMRKKAYLVEGYQGELLLMDNEGQDMTNQFLSLKKKKSTLNKDDYFDNTFDVREFFTKKKQAKIYGGLTQKPRKGKKDYEHMDEGKEDQSNGKGQKNKVYLEDIQFLKLENYHEMPFKSFIERLREELGKEDYQYLEKKLAIFKASKLSPQELFDCFYEVFGLKDGIFYFTDYMKTITNAKQLESLDTVLFNEAKRIPSKSDSLLINNKTYTDLFEKIVKALTENIFKRITEGALNPKKSPKKDQSILFQLIASLHLMHPNEITKFKMLANFLESEKSVDSMEKLIYLPKTEVQSCLNEITNSDLLMSFIYFNVSALRLANKKINVDKDNLNPNLLKLFLRHYQDFAQAQKIDIESDEEDYNVPTTSNATQSEEISLSNLTPNIRPPPQRQTGVNRPQKQPTKGEGTNLSKKTDIFVTDERSSTLKESDLKNKYEFPSLVDDSAPAPKAKPKSGWGTGDLYLYEKKGALSKKEQEELFPSLGGELEKPKKAPAPPPVIKPKPQPDFSNDLGPKTEVPGQFNWLEEAKRQAMENALNHGNVDIKKAKKKKKR